MSMVCTVGQITDSDLKKILENPKRVELLIHDGEYFEQPKKNFLQRIFSKDQARIDTWKPNFNEPRCDLDKAWHAIHYMLTGSSEAGEFPLNFLMIGGQEIGENLGYGSVRFLTMNQVKKLKQSFDDISLTTFRQKYNPAELNEYEVYPLTKNWTQEQESWIVEEYESLKIFIDQASQDSKGIYVIIS